MVIRVLRGPPEEKQVMADVMLSLQKNEKITKTVAILKSNSTLFSFIIFFLLWILKILHIGGHGVGRRH